MKDIKSVFRNLQGMLKDMAWFDDDWEIYNRGVYMQLYKSNWYNSAQGGIHFETFIEDAQCRMKTFPICFHAEDDCPFRQRFMDELIKSEGQRIQGWRGYRLVRKGYTICERMLTLNFKGLEERLLQDFNQLRQLQDAIDRTLIQLEGELRTRGRLA